MTVSINKLQYGTKFGDKPRPMSICSYALDFL